MLNKSETIDQESLVTIIIPSYNSGEYLLEAIASVLKQTYEEIEIIVTDDGSEGFCKEALDKAIQEMNIYHKKRIEIMAHSRNRGTVANINEALSVANGQYIMLLAADDMLAESNIVQEIIREIEECNEYNLWYITQSDEFDESMTNKTGSALGIKHIECINSQTQGNLYQALCVECFLPSGGTVYRKDFFRLVGKFDDKYILVEDWPIFLKAVRMNYLPKYINKVSVKHRSNGVSGKTASKNKRYQIDLINVIQQEILVNINMIEGVKRLCIEQQCKDKMIIYTYRFELHSVWNKTKFLIRHLDTFARRVNAKISMQVKAKYYK